MIVVKIIGMGMSPKDLTEEHYKMINNADVLVGGQRHLSYFDDGLYEKIVIKKHVRELARDIGVMAQKKQVVVLASGDPLYYGIGSVLIEVLGKDNVEIYPNVNSVAGAFARIKEPWQNAEVISLHGRGLDHNLAGMIRGKERVAVFTDPVSNPANLAALLVNSGLDDYRLCVLEQLGTPSEKIEWYEPEKAQGMTFSEPNIVIVKRCSDGGKIEAVRCGMPDNSFAHRKGLITKPEVRAVTLSKLRLSVNHVMWDLGAGSGSVSIEASLFIKNGAIYAVEQHAERIEDIKTNIKKFGVGNIEVIQEKLPEGLEQLPPPDRIFIGGGGRNLEKIITASCQRLNDGGVIVVNTVLLSNIDKAVRTLENQGFTTEIAQIQVSVGHDMPWDRMMKAQNPVWIISGYLNDKLN